MKKLLLVFTLLLFVSAKEPVVDQSSFCKGWEEGYVAGWCYRDQNCYEPYVPYCPYPEYGEETWKDGYNRGFLAGKEKRDE